MTQKPVTHPLVDELGKVATSLKAGPVKRVPKVAILGCEASGKTVLLSVLAHRYRSPSNDGCFLEQMNQATARFTDSNWQRLTVDRDWPDPTPPGTVVNLHWRLHGTVNRVFDLCVQDYSGETYREAFAMDDGRPVSASAVALREHVADADAIVVLLNLADYIDEPANAEYALQNQWAPKGAIDFAMRLPVPPSVVFVLTQEDRFQQQLKMKGTWRGVLRSFLPNLIASYPNVDVLAVAAVDALETRLLPDGLSVDVPATDFGSTGLAGLLYWIDTKTRLKAKAKAAVHQRQWLLLVVAVGLAICIFGYLAMNIAGWVVAKIAAPPQMTPQSILPPPVVMYEVYEYKITDIAVTVKHPEKYDSITNLPDLYLVDRKTGNAISGILNDTVSGIFSISKKVAPGISLELELFDSDVFSSESIDISTWIFPPNITTEAGKLDSQTFSADSGECHWEIETEPRYRKVQ